MSPWNRPSLRCCNLFKCDPNNRDVPSHYHPTMIHKYPCVTLQVGCTPTKQHPEPCAELLKEFAVILGGSFDEEWPLLGGQIKKKSSRSRANSGRSSGMGPAPAPSGRGTWRVLKTHFLLHDAFFVCTRMLLKPLFVQEKSTVFLIKTFRSFFGAPFFGV